MSDAQPETNVSGQEVKQQNNVNNPQSLIRKGFEFITGNFAFVIAIITAFGFFTVQSYLASLMSSSGIFSYNVSITQYLSAGISFPIALIAYLASIFFPNSTEGFVITFLFFIIFLSLLVYAQRENIKEALDVASKFSLYSVLYFLIVITPVFALIYGNSVYSQIPRMFGGGEPTTITLVFDEAQTAPESVLGLPINPANPRQSAELQLLIELTDGYLVRHGDTGVVVMVKGDAIQGVIYLQSVKP